LRTKFRAYNATLLGTREENQDRTLSFTLAKGKSRFAAIGVFDGVGSEPDSAQVAQICTKKCEATLRAYIERRATTRPLNDTDRRDLGRMLTESLDCSLRHKNDVVGSSTIALCLADRRYALVFWSGDSRVYSLDRRGVADLLTQDHTDEIGRITKCATSNIGMAEPMESRLVCIEKLRLLACVSDGISGRLSENELRSYLVFLMSQGNQNDANAQSILTSFMQRIAKDNASISYIVRETSLRAARKQITEPT
jgi:serine/threonine protein phosphatase PrpC